MPVIICNQSCRNMSLTLDSTIGSFSYRFSIEAVCPCRRSFEVLRDAYAARMARLHHHDPLRLVELNEDEVLGGNRMRRGSARNVA